jgi:pyruvate,water dikinase
VRPAQTRSERALELLVPLEAVGLRRGTRAKRVGGKAAALARIAREGFPVPRGWVLDARHFSRIVEATLPRGHDMASLIKLAGTRAGVDRAARARARLLEQPLPDDLRAELALLWEIAAHEAPWGLAVRSSGTSEDDEETSLAGLATTVLGVRGERGLEDAVRKVWASAMLPRAIDYLARAGVRDFAMAVLLQVMVRAEAAGVLFTEPPHGLAGETWRAGERLVNATFGLGAPVVDGARVVDSVRLTKGSGAVVAASIARKEHELVVGDEGLEERAVPAERADRPALTSQALRELAALADRLERTQDGALDVEFVVEADDEGDGRVLLLQVRRQTSADGYPEGGASDTVWSRTNVGEALPGPATPLTWSIARAFSELGFRAAFEALGCHVSRGDVLAASVHGRVYLNLTAFMRIAAQVPGLTPRALLEASGGASPAAIAVLDRQTHDVSRRGFFLRLPMTAARLLAQQATLDRAVLAFERDADRARRTLFEMDLTILPDDALSTTLKSARALLDRTGELMLTCASASLAAHLALSTFLERVALRAGRAAPLDGGGRSADPGATAARLAQMLTGGVDELESAQPGVVLARVAATARGEPAAHEKLLAGAVHALGDLPDGPTRRAMDRFLAAYGDRAVREAELSVPRWREDPSGVLEMLAAAVRAPGDPADALGRARSLADREIALLESRVPVAELALVRGLVARTQRFTRLRERMRAWVTRVLGMLRTIALDIDRRLRRIDPSLEPGSVFFCTYDELVAALSSGRAEVGNVVRLRHAEYYRDAARPDPPPTFIGRPPPVTLPPASGPRLIGLPASGGVVEGPARVLPPGLTGYDAVRPGEVLVSRTTDVGLSPLFLVAAAVVTELGGPLSHAAVVAREYGVPAVVSVHGATVAIRTGDRVRVDGDRGIVERLDPREPSGAGG